MWSGGLNKTAPNWSGSGNTEVFSDVGDLYILPDPPSIAENPSIGLEGRNEVPLPTKYKDLEVDNLTANTINGGTLLPDKWSLYPAIHEVRADREPTINTRQYDIVDFKEVKVADIHAVREEFPVANGGTITADFGITSPLGVFGIITASVGAGIDGSLVVNGGTTLDGGTLNGTSIGCLPVGGINTQRLDLLPIGIDMVSPTYITIDSAGACNIAVGGALSLAGGSYIEYNSDQHYFINSSAGNDFTDILVGNIHPAYDGTDNLRINGGGSGRGVYLDDGVVVGSKIHETPQFSYFKPSYDINTLYSEFEEADYEGENYISQRLNRGFPPNSSYQPYDDTASYVLGNLVFVLSVVYVCIADTTGEFPPDYPASWSVSGGILDEVWVKNGEKAVDNQVVWKPQGADGYRWSLIKLANAEGVRTMRQTIGLNEQVIGRLYDDTIYPPTIGSLPVGGNLQMNGYSVLGALNIQPSQYDLTPDWNGNDVYYVDDLAIVSPEKKYKCLSQNLNLNPLATSIDGWSDGGISYIEGNITTIGGGDNYICIFAYTTTTGDPSPNSDPTHWSATTSGGVDAFWELFGDAVRGGLVYQPTPSDTTYLTLIKPQGLDFLGIWKRAVGTNAFVNAGAVYDTTFNPPLIGGASSISVGGDLNMNTQNILNMGTAEVGEYDSALAWDSTTTYNGGEFVYVDTDKIYLCIAFNLNVDPLLPLSDWVASTPYEVGNAIKSVSTGYIYTCILAYAGGTTPPVSDTTHWTEVFITGNQEQFWAYQRIALTGGLDFKIIAGDYSQFSLIRPANLPYGLGDGLWITKRNGATGVLENAGLIYDTGINVPVIGGANSLSVVGDLDMVNYNVSNVGTLRTENIGGVATGSGLINVLDQLEGTGKSIQNFNYLNLISPASGDNATIDLRKTDLDIGLRLLVDADTGDATISAELGVPLTITTDNKLYLNGDAGIMANTLSMSGDIEMGANNINNCGNLETTSINTIANLFRRGNFASIVDQTFTAGSTNEQQIQMTETLGTTLGVSLNTSTFEISVDADGSYKVDMTYQLTSSGGSHTHTYLWVKNNGTAIPVSTQQTTIRNSEVQCVSYSRIFQLSSGDKLTFWWNSSNSNDYLYNTAQQNAPPFAYERPRQPSVAIAITSC